MNTETIWPNGARLALSIVVNVEEGAEMSVADGDKRAEAVDEMGMMVKPGIRNFSNESNYAYGIKAGAPRIMDMLARRNLQATFTAAAQSLERAPDIAQRIADDGHEICAHGSAFNLFETPLRFVRTSLAMHCRVLRCPCGPTLL